MTRYKVVETSSVTDEDLERIFNDWTARGWTLDGVRFVVGEASRRPTMAFVTFTREEEGREPGPSGSGAGQAG